MQNVKFAKILFVLHPKLEPPIHSFMRLEWFCSAFVVKKWRVTKLLKVGFESNKKDNESNKRRLCNIKIDSVK